MGKYTEVVFVGLSTVLCILHLSSVCGSWLSVVCAEEGEWWGNILGCVDASDAGRELFKRQLIGKVVVLARSM